MTDDPKWADINKQGSGQEANVQDAPLNRDLQRDLDNADRCSKLHQEANKLADRSGK